MISSGSRELDESISGYGKEVTIIYGPAASGKTTLCVVCLSELLKKDKKVVFVDTENGFSIERFMQISGPGYITMLDRLLVLKATNFEDQCRKIDSLMNLVNINLIIIDSLGFHYRKIVRENSGYANEKMERQLRILTEISRKGVPILITNQVSTNPENNEVRMVGGDMVKKWCKCLIELKKDPRRIILIKPEEREVLFEIVDSGIKVLPL